MTIAVKVLDINLQRAYKLTSFSRSFYYYQPTRDITMVKDKLLALAEKKPKEGEDKFYDRIRNGGLIWNC